MSYFIRTKGLLFVLPVLVVVFFQSGDPQAATLSGRVEVWELVREKPVKLDDHSNAVIFVVGFNERPPAGRKISLIQRNKTFSERVLPITRGEKVEFPNLDPIHHNVWSKSRARSFDLGLFKKPETKFVSFPQPGIVTVFCNIHPQMIATILVLPNNKYAVTGPDGGYRIENIPAGNFAVYAWVEGARPEKRTASFAAGGNNVLNFRLRLARIPVRHPDKNGKPYKKYGN